MEYTSPFTPCPQVKIMLNIGAPDTAFKSSFLPVAGVGLARMEFILAEKIKIHPLALLNFEKIPRFVGVSGSVVGSSI